MDPSGRPLHFRETPAPSILGTLFERGLDPGKRSQLGAPYTSREAIKALVEPVVMKPSGASGGQDLGSYGDGDHLLTGPLVPVEVLDPGEEEEEDDPKAASPVTDVRRDRRAPSPGREPRSRRAA